ncbi:T9SS type A sorting domain-containing protein [Hymenobacter sp. BT664]|uniref:T9SS type A sorting domain-containing protein n=1 Tax=Hymenobacter montanus TaxID=2771359 RepID=A0A927BH30_9BACT|nr:T9SS type A sorting domain-containing protein [Hymenobacter montanus]MBD2770145.1 T9SS type A sorting domain-containing protein [Hymenobacter montanus]
MRSKYPPLEKWPSGTPRARRAFTTALLWLLGHLATAQTVTLPIEVLGAEGTVETVTVNVPNGSTASGLWLQVNNLSYANKGSVRLNDGPWVPLNNSTVRFTERERNLGGIGGARAFFGTVKFTLPLAPGAVRNGPNTVAFRFNTSDGVSIGYRVLKLNFVDAGGGKLVPATTFVEDNPATWVAPQNNAAAIAAGKTLWETASLRSSYLANNHVLRAKCEDCHAKNARDLKYFAYSNKSIIERVKFHGLSQDQGEKIASYVRSLNLKQPGRPWNPPYQPGPGLDSKPVDEWAAGAGVDAVLDTEEAGLPYLFPNGITAAGFDFTGKFSPREIPVGLMLPDWKHWLPTVHPLDQAGGNFSESDSIYQALRNNLATRGLEYKIGLYGFETNSSQFERAVDIFTDRIPRGANTKQEIEYVYSTQLWKVVKLWELHQEFALEGLGQLKHGTEGGEPRMWLTGTHYSVFNVSPFMQKIDNGPGPDRVGRSEQNGESIGQTWYHLQLLLTLGGRRPGVTGIQPYDWAYAYGQFRGNTSLDHESEMMRFLVHIIAGVQASNNGLKPGEHAPGSTDEPFEFAWSPRIWGVGAFHNYGHYNEFWKTTPPPLRKQLIDAYLGAVLQHCRRWTPAEYVRDARNREDSWPPSTYRLGDYRLDGSARLRAPDQLSEGLPYFAKLGASCQLINGLADWAQEMWPNNDWNAMRVPNCTEPPATGPALTVLSPRQGAVYSPAEALKFMALAANFPQPVAAVEYYENNRKIGQGTGVNYALELTNIPVGYHTVEVRARDTGGTSKAQTVQFYVGPPTCPLPGTTFGPAAVFDGDLSTYVQQLNVEAVGLDLGSARQLGLIGFAPRLRDRYSASGILGAKIQGSNQSATSGYVDLYTIDQATAGMNYLALTVATPYRYVRLLSPPHGEGYQLDLSEFSVCFGAQGQPIALATGPGGAEKAPAVDVFPNPVSQGQATLRYTLAQAQPVGWTLYDGLGRAVQTGADRHQPAGAHTQALDFGGQAPGLYFLHLTTGTQTSKHKVVLLRP